MANEKETCWHPHITQERIMGAGTGDYWCHDCGATLFGPALAERRKVMEQKAKEKAGQSGLAAFQP